MTSMTTRERFQRIYSHREADRAPIYDFPWQTTLERWRGEGLPDGVDWEDFFGVDRVYQIIVDNSPRYPKRVLEETPEYRLYTTEWGLTLKQWRHIASTPHYEAFTIVDRPSWKEARERMTASRDRIDWDNLKTYYRAARERGDWIEALVWFGFDVTHSWAVGTERLLVALIEDPEWCVDMFTHFLEVNLALLEMVWEAGYTFDSITWYDDLGYKGNQFFSVGMYRELLKPLHKRAVDWAHARGIPARLHSCGDIRPFIPEFVEIGVDALNPLEVKAGVDPLAVKREFGHCLTLHGGINSALWDKPEEFIAQIESLTPELKKGGGYIFASDHSIPDSVSLETFRRVVETARRAGSYE